MAYNLFISYDLMAPDQHYEKVADAIKSLGPWAKVHYSLFYVKSRLNAKDAAEYVWKSMDRNDKLISIEASDAYWFGLPEEVKTLIQTHWNK